MNTAGDATLLQRLVQVQPGELRALVWSFLYFFSLLCSYYVLRPVRDEMGIQGGVENLQWVFTGTFLVMLAAVPLYGWAVARLPRRRLLPAVYLFFIVNLLVFYLLMRTGVAPAAIARAFFHLGQCVQSVRGVGVLELHGGHLQQRTGAPAVRLHRRRRQRGRGDGAGADRAAGTAARAGESVAGLVQVF